MTTTAPVTPNILFIQVDQLSASSLGAYGNDYCHAPTLDALAKTGAVFETAYCNYPLCVPSRASMATGLLCSENGVYDNAAELRAELPTYAHLLRQQGYHTCLSGKMHFIGPDQYHGFDERITPDLYPADFSWAPYWGDEGERDTNDPRSVTVSGICKRSVQIDFDELVTREAIQFLYNRARKTPEQPFFLQVSFTHPHEPYLCQQQYWDLYNDRAPSLPTVSALTDETHDAHSLRLLKDFGMHGVDFGEEAIMRARRAHFGSISFIDDKVSEIIATLADTGFADNTVIVFTSDHGDMLGERGMWFKKHFYEPSIRVPLFIHAPWIKNTRVKTPVSLVDLLPTCCGLAQGSAWESESLALEGMDLTPLLTTPSNPSPVEIPDRAIYAEYLAEATTSPLLMIRQDQYKFVYSSKDPLLLFDLDDDPNELNNIAQSQDQVERVETFCRKVKSKWNEPELAETIVQSQQRRRVIRESMRNGTQVRWNHGESPGEKVHWYRGEEGYNEWAFDYLP